MSELQTYQSTDLETGEITAQVSIAKRFPRNVDKAVNDAISIATKNREIAQSCIYFRPVGKRNGIQQFAEGGSIRLAEIIQSQWGNIRIGSRTLGVKDGRLIVQGVCHDLEKNVYVTSEVAKSVKRKDGTLYSDNQIEVVNMAGQAIARRNVVFSAIPKAIADCILDNIKEMIVGKDVKEAWAKAKKVFSEIGASTKDLLASLDCKSESDVGRDEVCKLHGLYNVIKDGLCDFSEVFGHAPENKRKGGTTTTLAPEKEKDSNEAESKTKESDGSGPKTEEPKDQTPIQKYHFLAIKIKKEYGDDYLDQLIKVYEDANNLKFKDFTDVIMKSLNKDLSTALDAK